MHGEGQTNAGKKDTRQADQIIDKQAKEGDRGAPGKEAEARVAPQQHRLDDRKHRK
jgi:hypothetical protein